MVENNVSCFYIYCDGSTSRLSTSICNGDVQKGWIAINNKIDEQSRCEIMNGEWQAEYSECEQALSDSSNLFNINARICEYFSGTFDSCASACRHDNESGNSDNIDLCSLSCVKVCKF